MTVDKRGLGNGCLCQRYGRDRVSCWKGFGRQESAWNLETAVGKNSDQAGLLPLLPKSFDTHWPMSSEKSVHVEDDHFGAEVNEGEQFAIFMRPIAKESCISSHGQPAPLQL